MLFGLKPTICAFISPNKIQMKFNLTALFLFVGFVAIAQNTVIKGTVTDAKTNQPLPFVSVSFTNSNIGTTTDINGKYLLKTNKAYRQIKVTFIGYLPATRAVTPGQEQTLNVRLTTMPKVLNEVTVKSAKKPKYHNKDNPAVELIRKVIENKEKNRVQSADYSEYEQYEKLQFSITNLSNTLSDRKFFRKYKFLLDNRDTTSMPGVSLLPVYIDEKLSQNYFRKNPAASKMIVEGEKKVNLGGFMDSEGIGNYLNRMYSPVDIYSNNIFLMTNQFLSPIADAAPQFYKFFITDTIVENNVKLVELSFTPRNTTDMLFEGEIYITLDGNYSVQKAKLTVNKNINLDWVRDMYVNLDYEQGDDSRYHLAKSDMEADFGLNKNGKSGLFGERTITYRKFKLNVPHPDSTYAGIPIVQSDDVENRPDNFWQHARAQDTLKTAESKVYHNMDSLQTMPSFKRTMDIVNLLVVGYKTFNWFEVGPANTFYSFNPIEGFRLRLGGRTTPELSKRYYFETYGAYGFGDHKWKYFGSATYSLNNKSIYKFPQDYIRVSAQRDTKIPGAQLAFVTEDNFLLSFKRGVNDKYLYNDNYRLDYVHELENHFSYNLGFNNWKQTPAGSLYFSNIENGVANNIPNLTTSELSVGVRYAPHEQLIQGKLYRINIPNKYPIIELNYTAGVKGLWGGQYNYQTLNFRATKRCYLSQLGYSDVTIQAGYSFGQQPYPLLNILRANQTYAYDYESYNLMNFLEFVTDHYASIDIDHYFNGFLFNKIPLIKKLKWREFVTFKAIYGGVRAENNPTLHPSLYQFPIDGQGQPITYALGSTPYTEGCVGISNILKFFKVDLVERFNYLDHPNVSRYGIRTEFILDF